jgi:GTP-binding protein YchF
VPLAKEERDFVKNFNFLTMKPILYVCNVSETDINNDNDYVKKVREVAKKDGSKVVVISAKIEEELSDLDAADRDMFLQDLGITESGLDRLTKEAYDLLGLATYFTAGEKECRAWTFKKGMKAPECAGIIHTDFERGFIRAETYSYDDLIRYGTPLKVKDAGKVRSEGKDYLVQDGDIMLFRFNV